MMRRNSESGKLQTHTLPDMEMKILVEINLSSIWLAAFGVIILAEYTVELIAPERVD